MWACRWRWNGMHDTTRPFNIADAALGKRLQRLIESMLPPLSSGSHSCPPPDYATTQQLLPGRATHRRASANGDDGQRDAVLCLQRPFGQRRGLGQRERGAGERLAGSLRTLRRLPDEAGRGPGYRVALSRYPSILNPFSDTSTVPPSWPMTASGSGRSRQKMATSIRPITGRD